MATAGQRTRPVVAWLGTLALLVASTGFALVVFEIGLRIAGYRAIYETYSKPSLFWQYDPVLGWVHEPNARGKYVGPRPWPVEFEAEVAINSLGLRGPELTARAPEELRVLFLGDSMVAGFEVEQPETYVALLERELTRRLGRPVRTLNAGVRGYGTDQYYLAFTELGRTLDADVVVVFHSGNDPVDNATLHETRRPFGKGALIPDGAGGLRRVGIPVPSYPVCEEVSLSPDFAVKHLNGFGFRVACRAQMLLFDHSALFTFLTISLPWDLDTLRALYYLGNAHGDAVFDPHLTRRSEHTRAITAALAGEIRASGAVPVWTGGPEDLAEQIGLDLLAANGVRVRDLGAVWHADQLEVRFLHDSHFNRVGHQRVAEILAPTLEEALRRASGSAEAKTP